MHIGIWLANRGYFAGLSRLESTQVYISEGTVGWGPRTRLFAFNERTLLTLRAGGKEATRCEAPPPLEDNTPGAGARRKHRTELRQERALIWKKTRRVRQVRKKLAYGTAPVRQIIATLENHQRGRHGSQSARVG